MIRYALAIYGKEMLTMRRDRRLVVAVTVTSLIVLPALMGVVGTIAAPDTDEGSVPLVLTAEHPAITAVLDSRFDFFVVPRVLPGTTVDEYVVVSLRGATIEITTDRTRPRLWEGARRFAAALDTAKATIVARALEGRGISPLELEPFTTRIVDVSDAHSRGAVLLGTLIPYLAIVLLVANAIRALYVAVGEKEHNTLASLLVTQVPRESIVLGKSLAITTFAMFASLLLVLGMALFANLGFTVGGDALGGISFRLDAPQIAELAINIGGLALLVSAMIMVVGTFARTQREAGVYASPLLLLAIFLAIFSLAGTEFGWPAFVVPILGNSLAMKQTILGGAGWARLGITLAANGVVFVALIGVCVEMYRRENVLFRR